MTFSFKDIMSLELLQKLKKQSKLERVNVLSKSDFFIEKPAIRTQIPIMNIAMGGTLKGGLMPGVTIWAGPSKHFKSSFVLSSLKSYLDHDPNAIGIWFDSEFGSPQSYFEAFGIDTDRVLHVPIMNIEELKFELMNQLETITMGDKVMMCIDSMGNLASKKEVEDALNEKSVADMTRAKAGKSLFRMVTPILKKKEIPLFVVQHTYQTMEMYAKSIVSGGCLSPETLVKMEDESYKRIDEIKVGEKVQTLAGPRNVTHTWNKDSLDEGTPECFEIVLSNGKTIICSDIHRFMDVNGEWVRSQELQPGMRLMDIG